MFFRARRAVHRAWFDFHLRRKTLQTSPLPFADSPVTVASMLCHGDLTMYLLALKSLVRQLDFKPNVVILSDGSLTAEDVATLRHHIPSLRVVDIDTIERGRCPKGGAWELLLMMAELVKDSYVIQVDSDTLSLSSLPEVNQAVREARDFALLGDKSYPEVEPMLDACKRSKQNLHPHVQALVERSFDQLPEAKDLRYLRGNAGFIGFSQGSFSRTEVEWFSDLMRSISGEKWNQWGSEQVTANLIIANSDGPLPLPAAKYLSYWAHPDVAYDNAAFLHFIGPHRYSDGIYLRSAKQVLTELGTR